MAGGYRQPANPAATSGPGALSQRTDGGAGSAKQPLRVASGGGYGARAAAEAQQGAAPMSAGGAGGAPAPGGGGPGPQGIDAFGPTQRPNESPTAGLQQEGMYSEADPYMMVRIAYQMYPHPSLARLLPEE